MHKTIYHKVKFYSPGTLFNEETARNIECWSIKQALEIASQITERHNAKPFGFRFQTWETMRGEEVGDFEIKPKKRCESGTVYFNGAIRTAEEVLAGTDEQEEILRRNVSYNEIPAIVQSIDPNNWKWTQKFNDDDLLVSPEGDVLAGDVNTCLWDKKNVQE